MTLPVTSRARSMLSAALLTLTLSACGGGGGGAPGASSSPSLNGTQSPAAAAPTLAQFNTYQTPGDGLGVAGDRQLQFKSMTKAGDSIWVVASTPTFNGVHTISVSDTQGNTYTLLDQENDGKPGTQSLAHFYAANIVGDTTTPDIVTVTWTSDDYQGVLIAEITGTTHTPLVGHAANIQDALPAGTDNVTAGPIVVTAAQTPALVVSLSMNTFGGTSNTGGSGPNATGPAPGSGLTLVTVMWDWGANLATFATGTVTSAESVTAVFSAPTADPYVTVAAVFH